MLLTVGTTEAVEAIAEAQENLHEVAKNPGILRTYFQNLVPDLLNFVYNDRNLSYIMLESEKEEQ